MLVGTEKARSLKQTAKGQFKVSIDREQSGDEAIQRRVRTDFSAQG